jgi:beta-mannosidase
LIDRLARRSAEAAPEVPWVPSSPTGGTHPFQSNVGVSHYYGVGAYRRPLEDARRAGVRFASECLAFSNVGEPCAGGRPQDPDSAEWKGGIPRDPGSDWDFEAVRDHYLGLLFGLDPSALRAEDPARYAELGALTTGEVMERVIGEWRRPGSSCRGALVWFLRDLAEGPGWGVIDHAGRPKPAWWHLRRAFAPRALFASDEGLNGLYYHIVNDSPVALEAELRMAVYRNGQTRIAEGSRAVHVPAHGAATVHGDAMLPGFMDLTYAYRFGPPGHDAVAARLAALDGTSLASAWYWPRLLPATREPALTISANARKDGADFLLTLASDRVAFGLSIRATGFDPEDNWFHLEPGVPRVVRLHSTGTDSALNGSVSALNALSPVPIVEST